MRRAVEICAGAALVIGACRKAPTPEQQQAALPPVEPDELRPLEVFAAIADPTHRSQALFLEAARVLLHPRCVNCHPAGDTPLQGDEGQPHDPPVVRGPDNEGVPGLQCGGCHQDENLELARVPGAPKWHLAPIEMAWVGRTPAAVCEQLKDPKRNGGKTLVQIVEHAAHDELVAWGWSPGHERVAVPGTQAQFGALMAAWVELGAACPREEGP
ncbi:Isoquinoline 1-oxidoreductase subunit [Nannocystis pusilla]|uniref:Isoquinoline 1-oxidoreductase subunit n=1 Tax=Nannocystis pusilla TaxID=889268 RepID=A0ABS7TZF4_9BACT|nr:Isoquinoline 1-oxidoreductase subunit [Nannocystis pusilla]MBZ5713669.1 Isoquinoline 1-oxidoreductase subunit [Nannocystis pusilla]